MGRSGSRVRGRCDLRGCPGSGVWAVYLLSWLLWIAGGMQPVAAQTSPVLNFGFETGDLTGWAASCFGEAGGCGNWTASVGRAYARSGQFGARLFDAQVGHWGHAQLYSSWFFDSS